MSNSSSAAVVILCTSNIRHMSPVSIYTDLLKECGIEYDLIYMDKYGEDEEFECGRKYRFVNRISSGLPAILKCIKYALFLPFASYIMLKNRYKFVIAWNDLTALLFAGFLRRHFRNSYCVNIRDEMGYRKPWIRNRYRKVFSGAAFCTTSSRKYESFLPEGITYTPINSLNFNALKDLKPRNSHRSSNAPLRIGFIGNVRFFEINEKLLRLFRDDPRFELHFYGTNANKLKKYAEDNEINNCVFHDSFPVKETGKYLNKIDILNNVYGNDTEGLRTAVSIKLYHAAYARIPILVCDNTYTADLAERAGIGFKVDPKAFDDSISDELYSWYYSLDYRRVIQGCATFLHSAEKENEAFKALLMDRLVSKLKK